MKKLSLVIFLTAVAILLYSQEKFQKLNLAVFILNEKIKIHPGIKSGVGTIPTVKIKNYNHNEILLRDINKIESSNEPLTRLAGFFIGGIIGGITLGTLLSNRRDGEPAALAGVVGGILGGIVFGVVGALIAPAVAQLFRRKN